MLYTSQLADLIVRLNVAGRGHMQYALLPHTKLALALLSLLQKNGAISAFKIHEKGIFVSLKYRFGKPLIKKIVIVSKPGRRVYWNLGYLSLKYNARNFGGFFIISTPKGLLTSNECLLTAQSGGEILLKIEF